MFNKKIATMKKRMIVVGAIMAVVVITFTSCEKSDNLNLNDIEGVYDGTFSVSSSLKAASGGSEDDFGSAVVSMMGNNQIEVHCFGEEIDTTFMLDYYEHDDSIMVCLTGEDFEHMYGHMQGEGHMGGGMMNDIQNGETGWMHHMDDEHEEGDHEEDLHDNEDAHSEDEDAAHQDEEEGLRLTPEQRKRFGITIRSAGPGSLRSEIGLPGEIVFNEDRVVHMVPRIAGIAREVVCRADHADRNEFSQAVFDHCRRAGVEYVVMGGFLKRISIPADFENRVINIHPALIPAFCGRGFYGHHVHEAVLQYGVKLSGCTVHFVDNQYDHGPVILQQAVEVRDDDTPQSLAARVFEAECEAYPKALALLADGKVKVEGRRVRIS